MTQTFEVGSQDDLNTAIDAIEQQATGGSSYEIDFTNNITEGQAGQPPGIYSIDLPNGVNLTINAKGYELSGNYAYGGLAVMKGAVTIQALTIEDTVAQGEQGE